MKETPATTKTQFYLGIGLVGIITLMFELTQVRMLAFFLGNISNFLAIPIALFGLALGSIYCHFGYKGDKQKLINWFSALALPVMLIVFTAFFAIANNIFDTVHVALQNPWRDSLKLLTYSALFVPAYFILGALLTSYFTLGAEHIGRLYFFDLAGAALGCLVTPLLFTYTDLPPVIVALLFFALLLLLNADIPHKLPISAAGVLLFGVVFAMAEAGAVFVEHPHAPTLARTLMRGRQNSGVEEVAVRWNDLARVSLIRAETKDPYASRNVMTIVQDDGTSNVHLQRYDPRSKAEDVLAKQIHRALPRVMGLEPSNVLVMFAGCGRDMVFLDQVFDHAVPIRGVEINEAVVNLYRHPATYRMNLHNFFARDDIEMVVREGRDFLNNDTEKYDFIYSASNGAVEASRTGHTRKYLDTYQAMGAYLDHLTEGGTVFFTSQPIKRKIAAFIKLFEERGLGDPKDAFYVFGPNNDVIHNLMVKPSGFTREQLEAAEAHTRKIEPRQRRLYTPFSQPSEEYAKLVSMSPQEAEAQLVTDDRPFIREVDWSSFTLLPSKEQLKDQVFASDWIKIFTVIVFSTVALLLILAARFLGRSEARLPFGWLTYFLASGIGYMCVEIGLMAKTELFVGSPLYAVAIILAFFLLFNSIGAILQDTYRVMRGPKSLIGYTVAAVIWSVLAVELSNTYLLSVPMFVKIVVVAVSVMPPGLALGMYYPFGVSRLVESGRRDSVPVTYGIATLSSVLGSSFAMTAITNVGFSAIIIAGAACYVCAAVIYLATQRFAAAH